MARESFSERNRRRREENAFENLYAYARSNGVAEPKRSAERAARQLHRDGSEGAAPRGVAARSRGGPALPAQRGGAKAATEDAPVPHLLDDRTKEQLYSRAQELDIAGRSQMTKDELIDAIRASQ